MVTTSHATGLEKTLLSGQCPKKPKDLRPILSGNMSIDFIHLEPKKDHFHFHTYTSWWVEGRVAPPPPRDKTHTHIYLYLYRVSMLTSLTIIMSLTQKWSHDPVHTRSLEEVNCKHSLAATVYRYPKYVGSINTQS